MCSNSINLHKRPNLEYKLTNNIKQINKYEDYEKDNKYSKKDFKKYGI